MRTWFFLLFIALQSCNPVFAQSEAPEDQPSMVGPQEESPAKQLDMEDESILQRHHPFYFVYGEPLSKLQLSFKSPAFHDVPLYFGYTQLMFWALNEDSKPFRDLTYNPELFYRYSPKNWGWLKSIDFGILGHHSNGKQGAISRSYDKQYLRFNFESEGRRWLTRFSLQAAYLHGFDPGNKVIQDYVGPLNLSISFVQLFDSWIDKSEVAFMAQPGGKFSTRWDQGGYQLSWSFRIGKVALVPAFYLQYYYGYAETLLNYDVDVREFRGGIIF